MRKPFVFVIALMVLWTGGLALTLAARDEGESKAVSEVGSAMAKAHPNEARAMLDAAEKGWQATMTSYDVGTATLPNILAWSRKLVLAQRALAETKEEDLAALRDYWVRSKCAYRKVKALSDVVARGGEPEKLAAVAFDLAEAELWLKAAGGEVPDDTDVPAEKLKGGFFAD
jgi:hypothetical protein